MNGVNLALTLLLLTCLASLARPVLRLPLPVLQIALGAIAAIAGLHIRFDPQIFLWLFIPPLLFADGWRMPRRELRALRWPVLGNAVGLVFATVAAGGYALHFLIPSLPLSVAFAIAAVVSPTDAVAAGAITEGIAVPSRLKHLLESEALLNDASGLVAFRFAVAATLTHHFSLPTAALQFVLISAGGLAIGWVLTLGFTRLIRLLPPDRVDAPLQALLSALLPFAAYWVAEQAEVSGILAAVGAGMAANRAGLMERAHYVARMQSGSMWRLITFSFNGIVFVLLGTQLPGIIGPAPGGIDLTAGEGRWVVMGQILALTLVLFIVRLLWASLSVGIARLAHPRDHSANLRVILAAALAGVRGAITLAGVLTLPLLTAEGAAFPGRDLAITLATGVILTSLAIAAIGLRLLFHHQTAAEDPTAAELHRARIAGAQAAVAAIARLDLPSGGSGPADSDPGGRREAIAEIYRRRLERLRATDAAKAGAAADPSIDTWHTIHSAALSAERAAIAAMRDSDEINDETARHLTAEIDLLEAALAPRPLH